MLHDLYQLCVVVSGKFQRLYVGCADLSTIECHLDSKADGGVSLEDINDQLDLKIEAEGVDRIAGWITAQMGRLPKAGEIVEGPGCRMTVLELKKRRVRTVLIEKT